MSDLIPGHDDELQRCRELVMAHGRRVARLWFYGATLILLVGGIVALYHLYRGGDEHREGLMSGLAVMGLGAPLIPMGIIHLLIYRRLVGRSTLTTCAITGGGTDEMLRAMAGAGPVALLGWLIPCRVVGIKPAGVEKDVAPARLFGDEVPVVTEDGYRCLATTQFGSPIYLLVCRRGEEPPPLEEDPVTTGVPKGAPA